MTVLAKGNQPGVERSIKVWCKKQPVKWIQSLLVSTSPPRLDVRGNEKTYVLVTRNRASLPISYECLTKRALTNAALNEVTPLGSADSGVVKDGIYVRLDITGIPFRKVFSELDKCAAVHVVAALITLLKNGELANFGRNVIERGGAP